MDEFGIKSIRKEDTQHLIDAISTTYPLKVDWKGSKYIGIDLNWDYSTGTCRTSMVGYNEKVLKEF